MAAVYSFRSTYAKHPGNEAIVKKYALPSTSTLLLTHAFSDRVEEIARQRGVTMAQIATAWTLTKVTAPVVGTTSLKNLEELAGLYHFIGFSPAC